MKTISVVTIIENNVLKEIHSFSKVDDAEEFFGKEILDRGIVPVDEVMENGYFEFENGETICLSSEIAVS